MCIAKRYRQKIGNEITPLLLPFLTKMLCIRCAKNWWVFYQRRAAVKICVSSPFCKISYHILNGNEFDLILIWYHTYVKASNLDYVKWNYVNIIRVLYNLYQEMISNSIIIWYSYTKRVIQYQAIASGTVKILHCRLLNDQKIKFSRCNLSTFRIREIITASGLLSRLYNFHVK